MKSNLFKKSFFVLGIASIAFLLTGCGTPKTPTNTDTAQTGITGSATATTSAPQIDVASFDADYQKNYTQALASVNTYLQNQGKFCSVIIDFPQYAIQFADQSFFFSANSSQVKDWYGVVMIDPIQKVSKRQLAAKKDYAETIQCVSSAATTPPNFSEIYVSFLQTYPAAASSTVAKTEMALRDTAWRVTAWDANGGVVATQDIPTSGVSSTSSLTPTATTTTGL